MNLAKEMSATCLINIDNVENEIDVNYNLDSLHLFLSNTTKEIIKSPWTIPAKHGSYFRQFFDKTANQVIQPHRKLYDSVAIPIRSKSISCCQ